MNIRFLRQDTKCANHKRKNDKFNFIKGKYPYSLKDSIKKMNKQPQTEENTYKVYIWYMTGIYNIQRNSTRTNNKKINNPFFKWTEQLNRYFTKRNDWIVYCAIAGKCKLNPKRDTFSYPQKLTKKKTTKTNAGKDMELFYVTTGIQNSTTTLKNWLAVLKKLNIHLHGNFHLTSHLVFTQEK